MKKPRESGLRALGEALDLGMQMVVGIVLGTLGGYYLETYVTHFSPWTTFIGFLVGVGAAISTAVRISRRWERQGPPPRDPD